MIRVNRGPSPGASGALSHQDKWGLTELDYALWFFAGIQPAVHPLPPIPKKPPKFSRYGEPEVKEALNQLFGNKCAYCESAYAHLGPMDVEHYRPKSGYLDNDGKLKKPGYYWLASEWDNLLPSCIDCNRERQQYRRARDNRLVKTKSGKGNKFPLAANSPRANAPGGQAAETPLLLNPCNDLPTNHLRFYSTGFVEPAATPAEAALPRGIATIRVFGLDRHELVGIRRDWAIRVKAAFKAALVADLSLRIVPGNAIFLGHQAAAENDLQALVSASAQYTALTNEMVETFRHTRVLINDYYSAKEQWQAHQNPANTAALRNAIDRITAFLSAAGTDRQLALDLLGYAELDVLAYLGSPA